jgi:hypothetical protein
MEAIYISGTSRRIICVASTMEMGVIHKAEFMIAEVSNLT